ncbi:hypothetical protein BA1DRAFT_01562 [Photorhabdus aegyptia]|uniref:Uncharacterized protein n=1 Tax=Photorhabdus aegyptia TaxID=2805098 RepID=A0A022PJY4_9GAMM|nr:hypothetical protein BA1DRAFT_01562 [Photorhabdus aegyptia]
MLNVPFSKHKLFGNDKYKIEIFNWHLLKGSDISRKYFL